MQAAALAATAAMREYKAMIDKILQDNDRPPFKKTRFATLTNFILHYRLITLSKHIENFKNGHRLDCNAIQVIDGTMKDLAYDREAFPPDDTEFLHSSLLDLLYLVFGDAAALEQASAIVEALHQRFPYYQTI